MRNEIVVDNSQQSFTADQIQLIKDTVCKGASDDELKLFMHVAKKAGLDPLSKQIYSVARWSNELGRETRTTQTGIDGFRVVAQRSGEYCGQLGPFWCGEDGIWKDVWLKDTPPLASKVGVLRKGFTEPLWAVANYFAYVQQFKDKTTGKMVPNKFWKQMPELMLAKVAEALALRKAFPQDLSGIFTTEEMGQAENERQESISIVQLPVGVKNVFDDSKLKAEEIKNIGKLFTAITKDNTKEEKIAYSKEHLGVDQWAKLGSFKLEKLTEIRIDLEKTVALKTKEPNPFTDILNEVSWDDVK